MNSPWIASSRPIWRAAWTCSGHLTPDRPVLGNQDISTAHGLPKATVSRLTYTLCVLGFPEPRGVEPEVPAGRGRAGARMPDARRPGDPAGGQAAYGGAGARGRLLPSTPACVSACPWCTWIAAALDPANLLPARISAASRPLLSSATGPGTAAGMRARGTHRGAGTGCAVEDAERFAAEKPMWMDAAAAFQRARLLPEPGRMAPRDPRDRRPDPAAPAPGTRLALNCTVSARRAIRTTCLFATWRRS
ncbi:helix-turn-helix domain-containing protein [Cupriavidus basilensis]